MKPLNACMTVSVPMKAGFRATEFYNKEPGVKRLAFTRRIKPKQICFADSNSIAASKTCLFLENDVDGTGLILMIYNGNRIVVSINPNGKDRFVFQQNHFAHWRHEDAQNKIILLKDTGNVFLSAPVNWKPKDHIYLSPVFIKKRCW